VLGTNNIDHHRTADLPAFAAALSQGQTTHPVAKNATRVGQPSITGSMRDVYDAPAILLIGNDPTEQHPLLAWQIRNNVRLKNARLYVVNSQPIKLRRQATSFTQVQSELAFAGFVGGNDSLAAS
jgi:NADH-quinone oxidoreductase subunit G